ncbi:MAG TPA: VOC family protein [Solirubrobacteraceae bacterium]|nr:VOC family protein [Solirubrobacteraceae bacterium]
MAASDGMVKGVDFVAFQTQDLGRAVTFYGETLGLPRSVHVPDRGFAEFETGNLTLSIIDSAKMGIEHQASVGPVALNVDDVAQSRSQLEDAGVSFRGDTLDTGVCHMAFFADPDGNALMLHHRYAPRHTDL